MSDADQTFVEVMATILIGTFIAYAVDLRNERDRHDVSREHPAMRGFYTLSIWFTRCIPLAITFSLILLAYASSIDSLSWFSRTVAWQTVVLSLMNLGLSPFMARIMQDRQLKEANNQKGGV